MYLRFNERSATLLGVLILTIWFSWKAGDPIKSNIGSVEVAKNEKADSVQVTKLPQRIHPIRWSKAYSFAGETVPIDNRDVYERLDRELLVQFLLAFQHHFEY